MKGFAVLIVTFFPLSRICLLSSLPPMQEPRIIDCTGNKAWYCLKYSKSCIKLRNNFTDYRNFFDTYPCCVCSGMVNNTCVCARGGKIIDGIALVESGIDISPYAMVTRRTSFRSRVKSCPQNSKCKNSLYCIKKCYKLGNNPEKLNLVSKCCSCGKPLYGGCKNCFYSCGMTITTISGNITRAILRNKSPRVGIFSVTVTQTGLRIP